jgi:acetyl esterase/lipase
MTKHKHEKEKAPFYKRKGFLWTLGSIVGVVIIVALAFRVSPWPGSLVIRKVFNDNGAKTLRAMEKHTPDVAVRALQNQTYMKSDKNAQLDAYYPQSAGGKLPVIIWTHGGAWLSGDKTNDTPYFKLLAAKGYAVIGVNYSLAPGAVYPTAVRELNEAHAYINNNAARFHADMSRVFFAGDSAGSNLSAQLAAMITNPAYAKEVDVTMNLKPSQLKGVILNCGIYKMEGLTQPDPLLPKIVGWGDDVSVWAYSGTKDFSDPIIRQMSPYYHVTKDFPPTYISGGNKDPLTAAQSQPFTEKLQSFGVPVSTLFFPKSYQPGLPHEYQFNLDTDAGQTAFAQTVSFVKLRSE